MYTLAKQVARNYSNVRTGVRKVEEHGFVKRMLEDEGFVPLEPVELHLAVAGNAF